LLFNSYQNLKESEFGCCDDQVTPAKNIDLSDCPNDCFFSLYGCCENSTTKAARGSYNAGCSYDEQEDLVMNGSMAVKNLRKNVKHYPVVNEDPNLPCASKKYECCPDGVTAARGPGFQGCSEDTGHLKHDFSKYGESKLFFYIILYFIVNWALKKSERYLKKGWMGFAYYFTSFSINLLTSNQFVFELKIKRWRSVLVMV
jgi:hypothetical protein